MKKIIFTIPFFFYFLLVLVSFPTPISAEEKIWNIPTPHIDMPFLTELSEPSCKKEGTLDVCYVPWIGQFVVAAYKFASASMGIITSIMIVWGGFLWMTAGGSGEKVMKAQATIRSALLALILTMGAYSLLYYINPGLTNYGRGIRVVSVKATKTPLGCCSNAKTSPPQCRPKVPKTSCEGEWTEGETIICTDANLCKASISTALPSCERSGGTFASYGSATPDVRRVELCELKCQINSPPQKRSGSSFTVEGGYCCVCQDPASPNEMCAGKADGYRYNSWWCFNNTYYEGSGSLGQPCGDFPGASCVASCPVLKENWGMFTRNCIGSYECCKP